jgi:ATP-dependent DNA helicase RecQ
VLALTATATREVVQDIQDNLRFKQPHVLSKSFRRANLSYVVRESHDQDNTIIDILTKVPGSAIVYVRSRRNAEEVSAILNKSGINSDYYHAGLSTTSREQRQAAWKEGKTPVIVATNAFGMGIDKPDVRVVIHRDVPDSPEAYFQEAGRGGRDGKRAYAVLLYHSGTLRSLKERVSRGFPGKADVRRIYDAISNHFQIPEGGGNGMAYEFNLRRFSTLFNLNREMVQSAIELLTLAGYIECSAAINAQPRVTITVLRDQLYDIEPDTPIQEKLLVHLMRRYPGIFVQEVFIDEDAILNDLDISTRTLYETFLSLSRRKIIRYVPGNGNTYILYRMPRFPSSYITLGREIYAKRKRVLERQINAMIGYITARDTCRQLYLMSYFDQHERERCGICDTCLALREPPPPIPRATLDAAILRLFTDRDEMHLRDLVRSVDAPASQVIPRLRALIEQRELAYTSLQILRRTPPKK